MNNREKIKLGVAVGALSIAIGLTAWYFLRSSTKGEALDPERQGPEVTIPTDPKTGKPIENFAGNRRTPDPK